MIILFKSIGKLLTGNIISGIIGFSTLSLLTYYGNNNDISYFNHIFNLAATLFTIADYGKSNAILLSNNNRDSFKNEFCLTFLTLFCLPILSTIIYYVFSWSGVFDLTLIIGCLVIQKTLYSLYVLINKEWFAILTQIYIALLKITLVYFYIFYSYDKSNLFCFLYGGTILLTLTIISFQNNLYNNFITNSINRIQELWRNMKTIGPNNISLIVLDRFEILLFIYIAKEHEYASLVTILGYSYLFGMFVDAVMKRSYKNYHSKNELNTSILISYYKRNIISLITSSFILIPLFVVVGNEILPATLSYKTELIIYSIAFQLSRFACQYIELDLINYNGGKLMKIRIFQLSLFFICFLIALSTKLPFLYLILLFLALRLLLFFITLSTTKSIRIAL